MRIVKRILISSILMLPIGIATVAQSTAATTLRTGEGSGANVVFVFDEDAKPPAIILHTSQIGVAGSQIDVIVDKLKKPVFRHIFTPAECKFGDRGSTCEVIITANDAAYRAILMLFKRGRVAQIDVQDAGVAKVEKTLPLGGFAKASH